MIDKRIVVFRAARMVVNFIRLHFQSSLLLPAAIYNSAILTKISVTTVCWCSTCFALLR